MRYPSAALSLSIVLTAFAVLVACKPDTAKEEALHPLRLGAEAVALSQELELEIDPAQDAYSGKTAIHLNLAAPSDSLRLHAEDLEIGTATLEQGDKAFPLEGHAAEAGLHVFKSGSPWAAGPAVLRIAFKQEFSTRSMSLYKVKAGGGSHVFTQFEAWEARHAFPCFDEPSFKIPWTARLRVPAGRMAIGNYPVAAESLDGDWKTVSFATTAPMPTYLVAFAVGDFDTVPIPGLSVPGRIVTLKGQARLAATAASMAPKLLAALEDYFGSPMPYPKLDLLSVPEFLYGAMENPGAITFRENLLLVDSSEADLDRRRGLASIMAHEMAHLWFGDLVTMSWWDDLWLNESFASWMGDRTVDAAFPEFKLPVDAVGGRQWAFSVDGMRTSHAIRTRILPTDNPEQSFDALAYNKGQEVLGMLEGWMGPETFRKGVNTYLREFAWKNTVARDLWKHLGAAAGRDVAPVTATFLDQPGVPLVDLAVKDGRIGLKQSRFLLSGEADSARALWKIPLVIRCLDAKGVAHRLPYLLETAEASVGVSVEADFALEGAVCHPNDEERGYYRWNLPPEALDALAKRAPELSERERVAFLGDLLALSESGAIGADAMLARLSPFALDSSAPVLQALLYNLETVDKRFIDSANEADFARYCAGLLRPVLERIGWSARTGEPAEYPGLRSSLVQALAEYSRDADAFAYADSLAALHAKDRRKVDPALASMALTVSARRGDLARFRRYRAAFAAAETPVLRSRLLGALGAFEGRPVADSALDLPLHAGLRPHEFLSVVRAMTRRRPHRDQALQWMVDHVDTVKQVLPPHFLVYLPWNASYSGEAWERHRPFFTALQKEVAGLDKEMEKVDEAVRLLTAMQARDKAKVTAFLSGLRFASAPPVPD